MARQRTYINDSDVTGLDRLTGIDSTDNSTKNFTIEDIAQLFASTGMADPTKLSFLYDVDASNILPSNGDLYFEYINGLEGTFAGINNITLNAQDNSGNRTAEVNSQGADFMPITRFVVGHDIKITDTSIASSTNYGIFYVNAVNTGENDTITLSVTHLASTGNVPSQSTALTVIGGATIDGGQRGNAIFDGTAIPTMETVLGINGDLYIREHVIAGASLVDLYIYNSNNVPDAWGEPVSITGSQGPQGDLGPVGPQGPEGPRGVDGPQGPDGPQGVKGDAGEQGPKGDTGSEGPGVDGVTSIEIEGGTDLSGSGVAAQNPVLGDTLVTISANGVPVGDQIVIHHGNDGLRGDPGPKGDPGIQGLQGDQGVFTIEVYNSGTAAPATPVGEYHFDDNSVLLDLSAATIAAGWTTDFGSLPTGAANYYASYATANEALADDTTGIETLTFSAPFILGNLTQGPAGPRGPVGPAGANGDQGDVGPAGRGIVSITDNDGDGEATVTYTDGDTDPLGLPQGPQGLRGPDGPQGDAGATGPRGFQGTQGVQGQQGPQGLQGEQGALGYQGAFDINIFIWSEIFIPDQGAPNATTYNTDTGVLTIPNGWSDTLPSQPSPGSTLYQTTAFVNPVLENGNVTLVTWGIPIEASGAIGPQGPRGAAGVDGQDGEQGFQGKSISNIEDDDADGVMTITVTDPSDSSTEEYDIAIPQGPQGPQGLQGPRGLTGGIGPTGAAGSQGQAGADGATGAKGAKGDPGDRGVTGYTGDSVVVDAVRSGTNPGDPSEVDLIDVNHEGDRIPSTLRTVTIQAGVPGRITIGTNVYNGITLSNGTDDGDVVFTDTSGTITANVDLSTYAKLASPIFTGTPTTSIPDAADDSQQIATTGWVRSHTGTGGEGATNLGTENNDTDSIDITSSTGTNVTLDSATIALAGLMSADDKDKLDKSAVSSVDRRVTIDDDEVLLSTVTVTSNDDDNSNVTTIDVTDTSANGVYDFNLDLTTTLTTATDIGTHALSSLSSIQVDRYGRIVGITGSGSITPTTTEFVSAQKVAVVNNFSTASTAFDTAITSYSSIHSGQTFRFFRSAATADPFDEGTPNPVYAIIIAPTSLTIDHWTGNGFTADPDTYTGTYNYGSGNVASTAYVFPYAEPSLTIEAIIT